MWINHWEGLLDTQMIMGQWFLLIQDINILLGKIIFHFGWEISAKFTIIKIILNLEKKQLNENQQNISNKRSKKISEKSSKELYEKMNELEKKLDNENDDKFIIYHSKKIKI